MITFVRPEVWPTTAFKRGPNFRHFSLLQSDAACIDISWLHVADASLAVVATQSCQRRVSQPVGLAFGWEESSTFQNRILSDSIGFLRRWYQFAPK